MYARIHTPLLPPYMAMYARMHAPLLPLYMVMYARMHALLLLPCGSYIRACMPHYCSRVAHICAYTCPITAPVWPIYTLYMAHICAYTYPIAAPVWPIYTLYMAHICAYTYPITTPVWPIYARIYTPLSGTKIRTIRKAVKKRQVLYLIWTSLLALAIYNL